MSGKSNPKLRFRRVALDLSELPFRPEPACLALTSAADFAREFGISVRPEAVDWPRELLIVVERGECPTGGYTVTIEAVVLARGGEELVIEVSRCDPAPDAFVTMVITYPRDAVAVARRGLDAVRRVSFMTPDGQALETVGVKL